MTTFVSRLGPSISDFLDYKHALGIKYTSASVYLRELDRYNAAHGDHHTLIKEVVDGWALEHAEKSTTSDRSWVSPIREFGRYLVNTSDISAYVLDNSFIIQRYRPEVYLMTEAEIHCFFKECDQYVLRKKVPGRAYVLPALYRFMYCCGVRSAEARQLKCQDVHLDKSYVDILWAKAHRDRRLFLSEALTQYREEYDAAIHRVVREGG